MGTYREHISEIAASASLLNRENFPVLREFRRSRTPRAPQGSADFAAFAAFPNRNRDQPLAPDLSSSRAHAREASPNTRRSSARWNPSAPLTAGASPR